jgi:hypothetical protein
MNAILSSLSELVKYIADLFRLSTVFPAFVFILLNQLFIVPYFKNLPLFNKLASLDLKDQALIGAALAILGGYVLSAIEVPIVRLFEGYPWKDSWWGQFLIGWQHRRMESLQERKHELTSYREQVSRREADYLGLDAKIGACESELTNVFPPEPARVLPTRLGNIIATFEAYPHRAYGMRDGVVYWPRLFPILVKEGFAPYISQARATVDFLLSTSLLLGLFGFECIALRIFLVSDISWVLPLAAFSAALIFYKAAISSAFNWGAMFRAGFDLFRYHLAEALGLKPVADFELERKMWCNLGRLWSCRKQTAFKHFDHSQDAWPAIGSEEREEEK